ncbi:hypothetical protein J437_LFUL004607 [Ladona fulva]|uniref:Uncharacterized protein n=1 Tax=Ladona fulva TaxID=123851 RepID=A0A8K0JZA8_LADFU|nr:hypothetical protein J437_LFUL004607 [Ladona fulva]
MKMLSLKQQEFIEDLLNNMRLQDLVSLANTVTANMISLTSVEEAKKCILLHTDTIPSLLKRKKITKELLFNYLHGKQVSVCPTLDKQQLIEVLLQYWNSQSSSEVTATQGVATGVIDTQLNENNSDVHLMSLKFAQWFYNLLNRSTGICGVEQFGIEHFWPDCSMKLHVLADQCDTIEEVQGNSSQVVDLFNKVKSQYMLYFHPNLTNNGVYGKKNHYGLVLVLICGTLHKENSCCGVFEQLFGLIEDPGTNNWKIKFTELKMKSASNISQPPSILDAQLLPMLQS